MPRKKNQVPGQIDLPLTVSEPTTVKNKMDRKKTETFKDWQKNVEKDIRKKCHFFTDKSMLSKIIH